MKRRIHAEYNKGLYAFWNFNEFMEKIEAEICYQVPFTSPGFPIWSVYHLGDPYFITAVLVESSGNPHRNMQPFTTIDLVGSRESINKLEEIISEEAQRM